MSDVAENMVPAEEQDFALDYEGEIGQNLTNLENSEQTEETNSGLASDDTVAEAAAAEANGVANAANGTDGTAASPEDNIASLQAQLNEAMGIIAQYRQKELEGKAPQAQSPAQEQSAPQLAQTQPGQVAKLDFLQGRDHLDILQSPEEFNNLLCQVATVSFNAAVQAAQEQVMRRIPNLVQSAAQQQMSVENIARDFYQKNPDLQPFKQAVSMAAMQLYNEHPELQLPDLLAQAAGKTREILRLSKASAQPARRPAQPAGGSIRSAGGNRAPSGQPQLSDQEQQILDLLTF